MPAMLLRRTNKKAPANAEALMSGASLRSR